MTPAQWACLKQAMADGGEVVMSGMDQTEPRPRRDVVNQLVYMGYLYPGACAQVGFSIGLNDYFRVTAAGRQYYRDHTPNRGEACENGECTRYRNINGGCDKCGAPSL